jgi:hypothetical protein
VRKALSYCFVLGMSTWVRQNRNTSNRAEWLWGMPLRVAPCLIAAGLIRAVQGLINGAFFHRLTASYFLRG